MSTSHGQAVRELLEEVFAIPDLATRFQRLVCLLETDLLSIQAGVPGAEPGCVVWEALLGPEGKSLGLQMAETVGILLGFQLDPARAQTQSSRLLYNLLVLAGKLGKQPQMVDGVLGSVLIALAEQQRQRGSLLGRVYRDRSLDEMLVSVVQACIR